MGEYVPADFMREEHLLLQAAEEGIEYALACLKQARVLMGVSPTPVSYELAKKNLTEEAADVLLTMDQLVAINQDKVKEIYGQKMDRWIERLKAQRVKEEAHGFSFIERKED